MSSWRDTCGAATVRTRNTGAIRGRGTAAPGAGVGLSGPRSTLSLSTGTLAVDNVTGGRRILRIEIRRGVPVDLGNRLVQSSFNLSCGGVAIDYDVDHVPTDKGVAGNA